MAPTKIRPFRGLRDGKEDPVEYIEDIEWHYQRNYSKDDSTESATESDKAYRLLFRQNLEGDAHDEWYYDLDKDTKQNWNKLKQTFLASYEVTEKDAQAKQFELRMKVALLKQEDDESIADYLKKSAELSRKIVNNEVDVGMATLRGMRDQFKREQINFECNKGSDYSYQTVEKLIKAVYSEVGKPSPFDPSHKDAIGLILPSRTSQTSDDLLRQALINTNQAIPALLQGFRSLNMTAGQVAGSRNYTPPSNQYPPARPKPDLSQVKCFICNQYGHYASAHKTDDDQRKAITANAAMAASSQFGTDSYHPQADAAEYYPEPAFPPPAACLMPISGNTMTPAMAAQKQPGQTESSKQALQKPKGILKAKQANKGSKSFNPPNLPKHILDQIRDHNASQGYIQNENDDQAMGEAESEDEVESPLTWNPQSYQPTSYQPTSFPQPADAFRQPVPNTRVTKTGKVQELVPVKSLKTPDPIRGMTGRARLAVQDILKLPITMEIGQFLDKSDAARQELALSMQRSTPKYRIKKKGSKATQAAGPTGVSMAIAASLQTNPPTVTSHAHEDDGQSQPLLTTAWVGTVKMPRTLLDGGSIVELVSGKMLRSMNPPPQVYTDGHLRVSLATDAVHTLTNYVHLPVNLQGIQAVVKAWVVDNQVYDLLLGVPWMRRVGFNLDYSTGNVTIQGDDQVPRRVPAEIFSMHSKLPTVEIEDDEDEEDAADAACQILLDEQENYIS